MLYWINRLISADIKYQPICVLFFTFVISISKLIINRGKLIFRRNLDCIVTLIVLFLRLFIKQTKGVFRGNATWYLGKFSWNWAVWNNTCFSQVLPEWVLWTHLEEMFCLVGVKQTRLYMDNFFNCYLHKIYVA